MISESRFRRAGFWTTVLLLLRAVRTRANGKLKRSRELYLKKSGGNPQVLNGLGFTAIFSIFIAFGFQVAMSLCIYEAVLQGERGEAELHGKTVVDRWFLQGGAYPRLSYDEPTEADVEKEAEAINQNYGSNARERFLQEMKRNDVQNMVSRDVVETGLGSVGTRGEPAMLGSIFLGFWFLALVCLGEASLQVDTHQRRYPMWEWLFSHPVPQGAIFLAEMLGPIFGNLFYMGTPLFVGILYGLTYSFWQGCLAAVIVGVPLLLATGCVSKALEVAVMLRFSPRSRGAILGLMGWFSMSSFALASIGIVYITFLSSKLGEWLAPFSGLPWLALAYFLGTPFGTPSFWLGVLFCWISTAILGAGSVLFSIWAAKQGLSGNYTLEKVVSLEIRGQSRFHRNPLYRKEILWFLRDRSALIQAVLVPASMGAFQLFNLRGLLATAQGSWSGICGAAVIFGTYFLWVLGPKSLASEGSALWIALTWPLGIEGLLKAKAWLWSQISNALVGLIIFYAAIVYPTEIPKIALVGVGWLIFGRTMALKAVTLVRVTSSSGETERVSPGRAWAASLGTLTFASGVFLQRWDLILVGIVYSYITAAAMWENLRARLPYLYDPWSEEVPAPPTLMNAMIGISALVDLGAVFTSGMVAMLGEKNIGLAQAIGLGVCSAVVTLFMLRYLARRGVSVQSLLNWNLLDRNFTWREWNSTLFGMFGGACLGILALGYLFLLKFIPFTASLLQEMTITRHIHPDIWLSYAFCAVCIAPFTEEILFRGLLFRALDKEWGGWSALVGSASFFAIYHPPISWLPVWILGLANSYLFKRSGRLIPCMALHFCYNLVVVLGQE